MKGLIIYRGRYTLLEEISKGGFATIWRAREEGRETDVAIKIGVVHQDPGYARSLREEARIIQRLDHRNIVRLYPITRDGKSDIFYGRAVEISGSPYFFVMEYLEGGTLEEYLKQVGPLTPPEAAVIGLEVARALDHIHLCGYAHNDLKLENVVFRQWVRAGQAFTPVLVDFGIATRVELQTGAGTFYIMSPEQVSHVNMDKAPELSADLDLTKVDVWGLGVVLYRMLGGRLPFTGHNERSLTSRILKQRPTSLLKLSQDIPAELDKLVIDGCLAKDPKHRLTLLQVGQYLHTLGDGVTALREAQPKKPKEGGWRLFGRD